MNWTRGDGMRAVAIQYLIVDLTSNIKYENVHNFPAKWRDLYGGSL